MSRIPVPKDLNVASRGLVGGAEVGDLTLFGGNADVLAEMKTRAVEARDWCVRRATTIHTKNKSFRRRNLGFSTGFPHWPQKLPNLDGAEL